MEIYYLYIDISVDISVDICRYIYTSDISEVKTKEEGLLFLCRQSSEVVKPPLKALYSDPPAKEDFNKSVDTKLEEITLKLDTLSSQVITLIGVEKILK